MTNAEWMVQNEYKFSDIYYKIDIYFVDTYDFYLNSKCIGKAQGDDYLEAFKAWLDMTHKEPKELGL